MATLRDIRRRIGAVKNTAKITQAMRMVSAAKLRRAQDAILSARPYFYKMEEVLLNLVEAVGEEYHHPILENRKEIKSIGLVIISADRGLCGSFNSNLLRSAKNFINNEIPKLYPDANLSVIAVGKRASSFFAKEKIKVEKDFVGIFQNLNFSIAQEISEEALDGFIKHKFDRVYIIYNEFKNLISQIVRINELLPFEKPRTKEKQEKKINIDYIFEPNKKEILDFLLPTSLNIKVWRALLESNAAEQAARMMAMENATKNANELIKHLELVYNKERQASITKEMLEIVGGAEALKGQH